jgi:branched-chain amino acid transport system ATP-binding protein
MQYSTLTWAAMNAEPGRTNTNGAVHNPDRVRALVVDGIDVYLSGVQILSQVTFDVAVGEVFGIVGPNGAGKTTILNVIGGIVRPTAGAIRYGTVDLLKVPPHKMRDHGIGRSLQSTHYFRDLTVLQLLGLGQLPNSIPGALGFSGHRLSLLRRRAGPARDRSMEVLEQLGLGQYAERPLAELSTAVQKLVDISRAVVAGTELLLLDEPTSGVSGHERHTIADALGRLRELGRTIVLIDHDPGFVTGICDRLMAMNFGQVLHVGKPDEVMSNETVRKSYLGEGS